MPGLLTSGLATGSGGVVGLILGLVGGMVVFGIKLSRK